MNREVVLCVDDEPIVLSSLQAQLRRQFEAFSIETAESASEAIELYRELIADGIEVPVVISDQIMPGMSGDELLAAIHQINPKTLTILLTGQASVEAVGRAVNTARLYRFIGKPWEETDLAMTLREAMRAWEQDRDLKRRNDELAAAHDAAQRFVPAEFLRILGRERLQEVQQADHAAPTLSILFTDIREFTTIVEGKTPAESFQFINEYARYMEPPIRNNRGFIDSIEGDAVMALFPESPDSAVRAGIASLQALAALNEVRAQRGERPVRIGVGVNTGPVILGIIGADRIKCGVIGDPVNLAARVESMTKKYGTPMMITEFTRQGLESKDAYAMREVDRVRVKGKTQPVTVYEILDGLTPQERDLKLASSARFAAAREAFCAGRFAAALEAFESVLEMNPQDGSAELHITRCRDLMAQDGAPSGWEGVMDLLTK